VDDIIIAGNEAEEVELSLNVLVETLTKNGWTINPDKIQKPAQQVKFLGIIWTSTGPKVPEPVINKIANLKPPENKTQMQHLIGLFEYGRIHTPYLQIILQLLYKVTRKASDFVWGEEQKLAFKTATKFISEFSQLYVIGPSDMVTLDIIFVKEYGQFLLNHQVELIDLWHSIANASLTLRKYIAYLKN
jgi:hypothetical protein